jgi:hypothetical protein
VKTKKNKQRPARRDDCPILLPVALWHAADKAARKAERSKPHNLKVGNILVSSWGYDQTNAGCYEVARVVSTKSVEIQKIAKHSGGEDGFMTAECWQPRVHRRRRSAR